MTTIKTNNIPRPTIHRFELTEKESKEFDYLPEDEGTFFRYRGHVYDLGEFVRIVPQGVADPNGFAHHDRDGSLKGWHGIQTDSFFSALVIRYAEGGVYDDIVVGTLFS
jgi:hypothetical protein